MTLIPRRLRRTHRKPAPRFLLKSDTPLTVEQAELIKARWKAAERGGYLFSGLTIVEVKS